MCFALFFTLNCMNIFVKSSHFGMFIVFSTISTILPHGIVSTMQTKAPPQGSIPVAGLL